MTDSRRDNELRIGIIGGGALPKRWDLPFTQSAVSTDFGVPSGPVAQTKVSDATTVYSILRHGEKHSSGRKINYLANVAALRALECDVVISICLAGTLVDRFEIGDAVLYDDVIDFRKTTSSFYQDGEAIHCSMAPLVDPPLWKQVQAVAAHHDISCGGTMVVIEGPRFSTRAESRMFAQWGGELICQTIAPECFLVREQYMAWVGMCLVTDRDTWDQENSVTTELIFENMKIHEDRFAGRILDVVRGLKPFPRIRDSGRDKVPVDKLHSFHEKD